MKLMKSELELWGWAWEGDTNETMMTKSAYLLTAIRAR